MAYDAQREKQSRSKPTEGELFKEISAYGKKFEIRYGFYEDCDRQNRFAEPVPIYPDFGKRPQYTDSGMPFVTAMQSPCENYSGSVNDDSGCGDCISFIACEELLGVCGCPLNARRKE